MEVDPTEVLFRFFWGLGTSSMGNWTLEGNSTSSPSDGILTEHMRMFHAPKYFRSLKT